MKLNRVALSVLPALTLLIVTQGARSDWASSNGDFSNSRNAKTETRINPNNVNKLIVKWEIETNPADAPSFISLDPGDNTFPLESRPHFGEVVGAPVVVGNTVYTADTAGRVKAFNKDNPSIVYWSKDAYLDYSSPGKLVQSFKATPTVDGDYLYLGNSFHVFGWALCPTLGLFDGRCMNNNGAVLLKINRYTGSLVWSKKLDSHPAANIRGSVSIYKNKLFVPITSFEEELSRTGSAAIYGGSPGDPYPCCTFRGSIVAVDADSGNILWQRFTTPGKNLPAGIIKSNEQGTGKSGLTGGAIWLDSPLIDPKRNQVIVSPHENYTAPEKVIQCERHRIDPQNIPAPSLPHGITCRNLNDKVKNYAGTVLALDMNTGAVKWYVRARNYDTWTHACSGPDFYEAIISPGAFDVLPQNLVNCPSYPGPDYGFLMPSLIKNIKMSAGNYRDTMPRDVIVAGEKDGRFFAINAENGDVIYKVKVGPGSINGGFHVAGATDGVTFYAAITNAYNANRLFGPQYPVIPNPIYSDPLHLVTGEFGPASGPNTCNSVRSGILACQNNPLQPSYLESGAGFDGNRPDGRWALVNPPQSAYALADGVTLSNIDGTLATLGGFWSAIDIATGNIKWQSPVRTNGRTAMIADIDCGSFGTCGPFTLPFNTYSRYFQYGDSAPDFLNTTLTLANGVLFSGGSEGNGNAVSTAFIALDAKTGDILWDFSPNFNGLRSGSVRHLMSVADGVFYAGSGFDDNGVNTGFNLGGIDIKNNKVYAFCLDVNGNGICDGDEPDCH